MSKIINLQNNNEISEFIESVKKGAIFAYPTEEVFGLGVILIINMQYKNIKYKEKRYIKRINSNFWT